jgi:hypothetical protein
VASPGFDCEEELLAQKTGASCGAGWCGPLRVNVRMVSYGNPMHTGLFRQPTVGCAFVRD